MACSRFRRAAEELGDVGQRRRRVSAAVVIRRTLCSTHLAQTVETVDVFETTMRPATRETPCCCFPTQRAHTLRTPCMKLAEKPNQIICRGCLFTGIFLLSCNLLE